MNSKKPDMNTKNSIPEIILVGLNHKTAPVDVRERFALEGSDLSHFLDRVKAKGIEEIVYVSTCNRVSIYFTSTKIQESVDSLIDLLSEFSGVERTELEKYLYKKYARDAVVHIYTVASSLDSMVIGETEIFSQVKDSYRNAVEHKMTGMLLNRLFHHAFNTAKKVRTETAISENPLSIAYIAAEQSKSVLKDLFDKRALLIGAGEMGELILKYLEKSKIGEITIANRSLHNAERIVNEINKEAHIIPLTDITSTIAEVDIIITSTGSHEYVLTPDILRESGRDMSRPLFMIDISVPRNIDPGTAEIEGAYVYNIDDLKRIADENLKNRLNEVDIAREIINSDATEFIEWYNGLDMVPIIVKIQDNFNQIRKKELERYRRRKLKHISDDDFRLIEDLTRQIMSKTLHRPITALKRYQERKTNGHLVDIESVIEELFD